MTLHSTLREWAPPALLRMYRRVRGASIQFDGNYPAWREAKAASRGYDDRQLVERVKLAMRQVLDGDGACERDGVVLPTDETNFPLVAALQYVALEHRPLRVLDFGGALGSTYCQMRKFFPDGVELHWDVVEQADFVECGNQDFAHAHLRFHFTLEDAVAQARPDVVLLSSVLPYLERPYETLAAIAASGVEYIILDRTPVLRNAGRDRLTVQQVRLPEYHASYPAWFFSESALLDAFSSSYRAIFRFESFESWDLGDTKSQSIGGLFRKVTA
jgi:putative methyltransferase (TIGR04325 family)